jgi:hypothetical protein
MVPLEVLYAVCAISILLIFSETFLALWAIAVLSTGIILAFATFFLWPIILFVIVVLVFYFGVKVFIWLFKLPFFIMAYLIIVIAEPFKTILGKKAAVGKKERVVEVEVGVKMG